MDETGQSGDTGSADSGAGADARDRTLLNGWVTSDSPWSSAGAALDPSSDLPAWRRPSTELRTPPDFRPSGDIRDRSTGDLGSGPERPPGERSRPPADARPSTELPPSVEVRPGGDSLLPVENASAPRWSDSRSRYADLLAHLSPSPNEIPAANGVDPGRSVGEETRPVDLRSVSGELPPVSGEGRAAPGYPRPVDVGDHAGGPRIPTSAPPYPYEGDLDDVVPPAPVRPAMTEQRAAMPLDRPSSLDRPSPDRPSPDPLSPDRPSPGGRPAVFGRPAHLESPSAAERRAIPVVRPATPGGRTVDWAAAESARHAIDQVTPPGGVPYIGRRDAARRAQEAGPSAGQRPPAQQVRPGSGAPTDALVTGPSGAAEPGSDPRGGDRPASGPPGPSPSAQGASGGAQFDPARSDPGQFDPARSDPGRADPARSDPGRAGPGRASAGQAEPGHPGSPQAGPGHPGSPQAGPGHSGSLQAGPGQPGSLQAGPGQPGSPQSGPGQPGSAEADFGYGGSGRGAPERAGRGEPTSGPAGLDEGPRQVPESLAPGLADPIQPRPPYDPSTFPRRLPYETPHARPADSLQRPGYEPPTPAGTPMSYPASGAYAQIPAGAPSIPPSAERPTRALPQRVPAEPDVPTVPEPPSVEPSAATPALARIATHLRRGDVVPPQERQEGFDVTAILAAVREVDGVRGASLRTTPAGAHSLRLDLADGADPAEVSRQVARLLQDRMGLDAAMQAPDNGPTDELPSIASYAPTRPVPAGRVPVSGAGAAGVAAVSAADTPPGGQRPPGGAGGTTGAAPGEQSRRASTTGRARAPVDDLPSRGTAEVTTSTSVSTAQRLPSGVEPAPPRPLIPGDRPGPRVVIDNVQVTTFGLEATVRVRLTVGEQVASGVATGPAVDGYLLRLCAMATASAIDELLVLADHADGPARCFVEHAASVPFGASEVAVVVLLLSCGGWVEQLAGSAVVVGDDRHAMVRATLAAVNRRLEALLS